MLAIQNVNPLGNVLHIVAGEETTTFQDIHGAAIMEITPMLANMERGKRVFLSLTRCRNEEETGRAMHRTGLASPRPADDKSLQNVTAGSKEGFPGFSSPGGQSKESEKTHKKETTGTCSYCSRKTRLLPVPGFKICVACAQIELGRRNSACGDNHGVEGSDTAEG